jgi:hypothetical protein
MGGGRRKRVSNLRRETEGVKGWSCLEGKQVAPPSALLVYKGLKGLVPRQPSLTQQNMLERHFHAFEAFDKFVTRSCGRREEKS